MIDWLSRYLPSIATTTVIVIVLTLAQQALDNRNARRRLILLDPVKGCTVVSGYVRLAAIGFLGFAAVLIPAGIINFTKPGQALPWSVLMIVVGGGGIGLWMQSSHRWEWDDSGICWIGVLRSKRFAWADIAAVGRIWIGESYHFARSSSGKRIWWSQNTLYQAAIEDAVRTWRPDLYGLMHKPGARSSLEVD